MYSYIHGGAEKSSLRAEDQILVTVEGMIQLGKIFITITIKTDSGKNQW